MLLDLGLPDIDGVDVCRAIRAVSDVPVIVVSARGEVDDRILGLHSGADDYLVKPYDIGELRRPDARGAARRAPASRAPASPGDVVEVDDVRVDLHRHEVTVAGQPVALTRKEFQVLALLATRGRRGVHARPDRRRGVGPQLGRAPTARWTCTWRRCAPSSAARSWCRRCAGSATGSASPTRRERSSACARGCW